MEITNKYIYVMCVLFPFPSTVVITDTNIKTQNISY